MNHVVLIGRMGRDPEVRSTASGKAVCTLSLATDERWTDSAGTKHDRTEWHRVEVWGKQAEMCGRYLAKGREVCVEGSIRTRQYDKDGTRQYITEVVAQRVQFLGGRGDDAPRGVREQRGSEDMPPAPVVDDDDFPF